jgi:hypothetical protein
MKTNRDKWLLALIPAMLTAIFYVFSSGRTAQRAITDLQAQLAKEADTPAPNVAGKQKALMALNERLAREKQHAAALKSAIAQLPGLDATTATRRTNVLQRVHELFSEKKLLLVKSVKLEHSSKGVPSQTEALAKRLTEQAGAPHAEFYQFELNGDYPKMLDTLQALDRSGLFIVPVSISMEPLKEGGLRWLLTVWI